MNSSNSKKTRRNVILGAAGLASLLTSGCSLPSKEEWAQVQQRGLIPVLIAANRDDVATPPAPGTAPSLERSVPVHATQPALIAKSSPTAELVPGKPGFVFSPHTSPRKIVDVRSFRPGQEVRCPYSAQPFHVPNYSLVASAPAPSPAVRPVPVSPPVVNRVASDTTPSVPPVDPGLSRLEPVAPPPVTAATPPPAPATPPAVAPPSKPPVVAAADAKPAIPYGTRVQGRPGLVYSPHVGKTQVVDVAGTAPGVVVKCPYTGKLFRVPEPLTEEIAPETFPLPLASPDTGFANIPLPPAEKEKDKKDNNNTKPQPPPR